MTKNADSKKRDFSVFYERKKDLYKERAASWALENKERRKAICKKYRDANKEKCKAAVAASVAANPLGTRLNVQNRRAKKREIGGRLTAGLSKKLFKLQKGKCPCCQQPLGDDYHLDHIIPTARGGTNTDDNIQLLRAICNMQKNAKDPIEFMQQRGFLL